MAYTALYRKFRPNDFSEVKGQNAVVTTLVNQIRAERIGHAYIFNGTRGTGKTSVAKIFAKAVNCESPKDGNPCGECSVCRAIKNGTSMNVIEMDAASNNGVDSVREIVEEVKYSPSEGRYKVYIIDEAHMLSTSAFNALLKTLEEPPAYVIFILATTEIHKIPITILSRCQRYDFKRITIEEIEKQLSDLADKEGVRYEQRAMRYIATMADGSMRDGLSLLDRCIAFYLGEELTYDNVLEVLGTIDTEIYLKLSTAIREKQVANCVGVLDHVVDRGRDIAQFINDYVWFLRNMMLLKCDESMIERMEISTAFKQPFIDETQMTKQEDIMRRIRILSELAGQIRYSTQKRVQTEMALIRLVYYQSDNDRQSVDLRLTEVEKKLEEGVPMAPAPRMQAIEDMPIAPVSKEPPPKRLPGTVMEFEKRWSEFVATTTNMMNTALLSTRLTATAKSSEEGVIELATANEWMYQTAVGFEPEDSEEVKHKKIELAIGKLISDFMGKEYTVKMYNTAVSEKPLSAYTDITKSNLFEVVND